LYVSVCINGTECVDVGLKGFYTVFCFVKFTRFCCQFFGVPLAQRRRSLIFWSVRFSFWLVSVLSR
jgi:hypothetical protein